MGDIRHFFRRFFFVGGEPTAKLSAWFRYGVTLIAVGLATALRVWFYYNGAQLSYLSFYPALVLVALYLGLGPGVLAVILSAISVLFWLEPVGEFVIASPIQRLGLAVFVATGFLLVWVCERLRRALDRAEMAEEALRVMHRKETSQLLDSISDGFFSLDREWHFTYLNSSAGRLLRVPPETLLGKVIWEVYPALDGLSLGREYRRAMRENIMVKAEDFYPEPLNAWYEARCYPSETGLSIFFADLTDQKEAQEALWREQEFSRALVENMVDAVVACDSESRLNLVNRAARQWHGVEALGTPPEKWAEFYHLFCADGVTPMPVESLPLVRAMRGERFHDVPVVIRPPGQPLRHTLVNGVPFFDEKGRKLGAVVVMHDITQRKYAEEELYRLNRLYAVLSQVNQAVIRCTSREELFRQICRVTVDYGDFKMAWVGKIDPETHRVVPIAAAGDKDHYLGKIQVYTDDRPEGRGPVGSAIRQGRTWISNDFSHDPDALPWHEAASAAGFHACIALPIRIQGTIFGALAVYSGDLNYFHEKEIRLLEEVASDISFALDHLEQEFLRQQDEIALKQAKEVAEAASRAKDQFIAVLSHELRTPLTPVLTAIVLMQTSREWSNEDKEEMEMIRRNVELEAKLIDDLLDITRISRGLIKMHREEVDAHACLGKALEICRAEMAAKSLNVSVRLDALHSLVWADPARLQQVFWNLIKNAVKFTPLGGHVGIVSFNDGQRLKIEVSDTGIGIEADVLPRIFNAFEQGEKTRSRQFGGLGLGLSIAKNVVELHHGSLTAFSEGRNKGARFVVELDTLGEVSPPSPVSTAEPPQHKDGQLRILLVEDHLDTLNILSRLLQKWGYVVVTADSVAKALDLTAAQPFDILISDIGLPDGNGLDIMRKTKGRHRLRGIALSGFGTDDDLRQSRAAGFEEHLTKPVGVETLRAAVERLAADNRG